ncbi:Divalent metal cation (Fe/Co/Zn/Cd) transporter [Geosmithia morbida]|uniref:Divalent metal cation (Fe/Co/Zn/Cd) transporter n=1 Tax=Geosmithia morbida TaxID=1094350 RepID=A0A9P4YVJ6_9HYPO|nr:Divalent metal cation (Fe/Co/Zn/Cd) transporter [Geosmithia morbida]KAF4122501.1 Divalent metal cation (Fe/Co/Zn/Cd) transporter [Geosmithia morbida]
MTSPATRLHSRRPSTTPSLVSVTEDYNYPLPTRSGVLASLIRTRSVSSLSSAGRRHPPSDEEACAAEDDIERLIHDEHRLNQLLHGSQARSKILIGKSNPRYRWERYWKDEEQLDAMSAPLRNYYERTNELIEQYLYIDRLLDSTIPHEILSEYSTELEASAYRPVDVPATIPEDDANSQLSDSPLSLKANDNNDNSNAGSNGNYGSIAPTPDIRGSSNNSNNANSPGSRPPKQNRTPKDIFRSSEALPLLQRDDEDDHHEDDEHHRAGSSSNASGSGPQPNLPWLEDAELDSDSPIVTLAIWINLIANTVLLLGKLVVVLSVPSMSVLASLVDAVLDFLSTAIVWTTTRLISRSQSDQYSYPVGRRRLEPVGVLVFSIIMITCFFQVGMQCIHKLMGPEHTIVELGVPAIAIMGGTIVIKGVVWIWCRLVRNSSVRALAEDCKTDVIFNTGSILFPIIGWYGRIWWLDALGGLLLSAYVVFQWSDTSAHHVRNLTGFSASPDERNLLLYLTMRFATSIRNIQNLRAYHAGDRLFVEVDIVLDASMPLKDSHDLSEVLTYFLESVPIVDRAFVHVDYTSYNAPTHMLKQDSSN